MNITVFLGSSSGTKKLREEAARLGAWIAQKKHHLIYGGSSTGLMGILARSAMDGGAAVTGVEIAFLTQQRQSQGALDESHGRLTSVNRNKALYGMIYHFNYTAPCGRWHGRKRKKVHPGCNNSMRRGGSGDRAGRLLPRDARMDTPRRKSAQKNGALASS